MVEKILDLLENKKFKDLKDILEDINSADFPEMFDDLEIENVVVIFRLLSKEKAVEVFSYLDSDVEEDLINALTDKELEFVVNELVDDDVVDLIEEMPAVVVKRILIHIKPEQRKIVNELLQYPEDTAGSLMTTDFIDFKEYMTVRECFDRIKKIGLKTEAVYLGYVLEQDRTILGIVRLKNLLVANENTVVRDLMETNFISATTLEDKEDVAKKFDKYDVMALPVVDKENKLVGIVTIDDAIDVIQEEVAEDFEKMAAITPKEDSYLKTSAFKHARNRILWLLLLMVSSTITGTVLSNYQEAFVAIPLLVAFIPMLMDTGGNCGSQTATLIIRGLAMDEIKTKDIFKALWKELRVAIIVAIVLMLVNGTRIVVQYQNVQLAVVVGLTLAIIVIISKLLGCILPILAKKLKLDPAIMAAPLITTIVDICSNVIYFKIATLILHL